MELNHYQHWQLEFDPQHVLWAGLSTANSKVNTLGPEVLTELDQLLNEIKRQADITGLIIYSLKPSGFIAGADIKYFASFQDIDAILNYVKQGQDTFDKLAELPIKTLAMIDGFCLGGGLELALACDYRIATDSPKTRLGLPEVKLGIIPGWGGTRRLIRKTGPLAAMNIILAGQTVVAKVAKRMGFVDDVVPQRQLKRAACYFMQHKPVPKALVWYKRILNYAWCRRLLASKMRKLLASKKVSAKHYPAPYYVIDNWQKYGIEGYKAKTIEVDTIKCLIEDSDTAKNLTYVFNQQEQLKALADPADYSIEHVHVVGAGIMGGDIAIWCALRGLHVTLQDSNDEALARVFQRAYKLFTKKLKSPYLITAALDRITVDAQGHAIKRADLIIEAVFEDLATKQALFTTIEQQARPETLLATNTSSIALEKIASALQQPSRLVGIHFFNPVAVMQLVEVVKGTHTDPQYYQQAMNFVRKIDRLPLPVKSSPGFAINRILMPYLLESVRLLEDGVPAAIIDEIAEDFGMPMGPIELADTVGLDICLAVAENLSQYYSLEIPQRLKELVAQQRLGKKSQQGFYQYHGGKIVKEKNSNITAGQQDIANRLIGRMLNEAVACLHEEIVANPQQLDAGMVFGTGFAPFRGGPMHYAQQLGEQKLLDLFTNLEKQYGERFKAETGWKSLLACQA
ncbi:MAG: 3-hydroxyacyl-CoA dehydrogenase NAD-binding domain-containing protein [Gammaproteobacteria bacterium]